MAVLFALTFLLAFWGGWWSKDRGWWWLSILLFIVVDYIFLKIIKSLK